MNCYKYRFSMMFIATILCRITFAVQNESTCTSHEQNRQSTYSFAFMGDFHFDRLSHHDMDWVQGKYPADIKQIETYSQITEQNSQKLLEAVYHSLKDQNSPAFATIQAGDFVEGLCGSYERQAMQFREAIAFVEKSAPSISFMITKGNHDITGPGAHKAYADVIIPWLETQSETPISGSSYFIQHKGDLFIFFDSYKPDLDWLDEVLNQYPARHVFFIIHQPVVPYDARSNWHVFADHQKVVQRKRLLELLGKYHVIVLCGHLHQYSVLHRKTENGFFVQVAMNSVMDIEERKAKLTEGVDKYGPELVNLEVNFSPDTKSIRMEILEKEKPFINYFELARVCGYCIFNVTANHVDVNVYLRNSQHPWRRLHLQKNLCIEPIRIITDRANLY